MAKWGSRKRDGRGQRGKPMLTSGGNRHAVATQSQPVITRRQRAIPWIIAAGLALAAIAVFLGYQRGSDKPSVSLHGEEPQSDIPQRPVWRTIDKSPASRRIAELRNDSFDVAERLVRVLPGDPHALCLLATVHHRHANETEAVRLWRRCIEIDDRFADAYHSLGLAALEKGDFSDAEGYLRKAHQIDPDWPEIPLPLAKALANQGKIRDAVEALEAFLRVSPTSIEAWCRLGQAYQQLGDYAAAKRAHLKAVAIDPACTDAHYGAAIALAQLGETEPAREHREKFRELTSHQDHTVREAREGFTDESRMRATAVNTRMTAGRVYALRGRMREAEEQWKQAALLDPGHQESRERLCQMYFEQQRFEEALATRQELCELAPDDPGNWLSLGKLSIHCGRPAEAEAPFRRVIELAPQRSDGYAALAEIYLLPGRDPQQAIELAQTAVELAATAPHYFVLAAAFWNAGDGPSARAAMAQAVKLDPTDPRYREGYARLQQEPSK